MGWLQTKIKKFQRWQRQMSREGNSFTKAIVGILVFPIKVLFFPFKSLSLFHDMGVKTSNKTPVGFNQKVGYFFRRLLWTPVQMVRSVLLRFSKKRPKDFWRELLFLAPATAMLCLIGFVFAIMFFRGEEIKAGYQKRADQAFLKRDFKLAKVYYQRLMSQSELTEHQRLVWAVIQSRTGDVESAKEIIDELAPDKAAGLTAAHRTKALTLAAQLQESKQNPSKANSSDPKILEKLKWHLEQANDESTEILEAWAAFHLALEDFDEAIPYLLKAAKDKPVHYFAVAAVRQKQGNVELRDQAISNAENAYRRRLENDPLDNRERVAYANVLVRQSKFREAENVMLMGIKLAPDDFIKRSLSNFFVMQHDLSRKLKQDAGVQLSFLMKALKSDPNDGMIYQRLVAMHTAAKESKEELEKIRMIFQEIVASDRPTAMAHMALSNVLWEEGKHDQATFHLEQAYSMDRTMVRVINDLSWMLANSEPPDLARALELVETAVAAAPTNPRIRDTYGTILMKLNRFKEAATELNLALKNAKNPRQVHSKLQLAYEKLGMSELAELHRKQAFVKQKN